MVMMHARPVIQMHGEGASRLTRGAGGTDELEVDVVDFDFDPDPDPESAFFFPFFGGVGSAVVGSRAFHQLLSVACESGWM
jgi:hypothetical protein